VLLLRRAAAEACAAEACWVACHHHIHPRHHHTRPRHRNTLSSIGSGSYPFDQSYKGSPSILPYSTSIHQSSLYTSIHQLPIYTSILSTSHLHPLAIHYTSSIKYASLLSSHHSSYHSSSTPRELSMRTVGFRERIHVRSTSQALSIIFSRCSQQWYHGAHCSRYGCISPRRMARQNMIRSCGDICRPLCSKPWAAMRPGPGGQGQGAGGPVGLMTSDGSITA